MSVHSEKTLTFRASGAHVEQTRMFAKSADIHLSEYIRNAVQEKNERQIAERMRFLSQRLAAESLRINQEFEAAAGDGIA